MVGHRPLLTLATIAVLVVIVGVVVWRSAAPPPLTPTGREAAATELISAMHISVSVQDSTLAASKALVDFLRENDVRLVLVRIVEELDLEVRIEARQQIAFAEPLGFCLIGPYSAPDDAGYSSPCWGAPDLGEVVAAQLPSYNAALPIVPAGATVLSASVQRGAQRCDYPPGRWLLVVKGDPLVDGEPAGARELAEIGFDVPWEVAGPLPFLEVRTVAYCGLANAVYREQGEPEIVSPP